MIWKILILSLEDELSKNYISDVERGTRNITLKVVDKFAIGLEVHPSYLFQWHDE